MKDRELLEAAAKAAGIEVDVRYEEPAQFKGLLLASWKAPNAPAFWNPLTDDGDAFRLAVKCDIELYRANDEGWASYAGYWGKPERRDVARMFAIEYDDDINNKGDPYAATRRAIVRAAAEIGRVSNA